MEMPEQEKLEEITCYDVLTKLPNKVKFIKYFKELKENGQENIAIIYLDLDRFKIINNSFGHDIGDYFLRITAERIIKKIDEHDMVARFGGDEFAIMLPAIKDARAIKKKYLDILQSIEEPWLYKGWEFNISASAGIVIYPDNGDDITTLIKNSDLAMYYAKKNNLDYKFFTDSLGNNFMQELTIEKELKNSLSNNEFELYYQPLVNLSCGRINAVEALLRWHYGGGKIISPVEFISIAEKSGLIVPIGRWVFKTACQQIVNWNTRERKKMRVAINFSAIQFNQVEFLQEIKDIIKKTGVNPGFLEGEITESVLMTNPVRVLEILKELKHMGVKLVLDDFGTGYSSLNYLKIYPVDKIKIDKSFIIDLFKEKDNVIIVKTIINLAHKMGLKVVAEGVESLAELKFLKKHGCDEIQGYYLSRPIPVEEFEKEFLNSDCLHFPTNF